MYNTKGRDFDSLIKQKVATAQGGTKIRGSLLDGYKNYLKEAIEDAHTRYTASNLSKNPKTGVSVIIEKDLKTLSLADKATYEIDKIAPEFLKSYTKADAAVFHRGDNYNIIFRSQKAYIFPKTNNHFETMENLVMARVAGKIVENDNNNTTTQKNNAYSEYNTLKAAL